MLQESAASNFEIFKIYYMKKKNKNKNQEM